MSQLRQANDSFSHRAGETDFFSLDELGNAVGDDWRKVYSGNSTFKDNFAAGTAFLAIRRKDEKGLQLSQPASHEMQAIVLYGMKGWTWSGSPATRSTGQEVLSNPIWIAVNMMLRSRGLRFADATAVSRPHQWFTCIRLSNPHMT